MDMSILKTSEPTSLITNGLIFLFGFSISLILLNFFIQLRKKEIYEKKQQFILLWSLTYFNFSIFAICSAISHATTLEKISELFWPLSVIFGGFGLFFLQMSIISEVIYENMDGYRAKVFFFSLFLMIGYQILLYIFNWNFLLFGLYLFIMSLLTFVSLKYMLKNMFAKNKTIKIDRKTKYLIILIIITALIQIIGFNLNWYYRFGQDNQYIFIPHNDIFHLIVLYLIIMQYRRIIYKIKL